MVRFQAASGNNAAKLVARGKHFVLFDEPADKGNILKESYPDLGWATSIEGHPTLPYSRDTSTRLLGGRQQPGTCGTDHERPAITVPRPTEGPLPVCRTVTRAWRHR